MVVTGEEFMKMPYGYWWILRMCEVCDGGRCMNKAYMMTIEDNMPVHVCEEYIRRELIKE
jgi:hypothetical protein